MMELPCISAVEACVVQPLLLAFCQEIKRTGIILPRPADHSGPEVSGDLESHVAAEAVDAAVQPEPHALLHLGAHVGAAIVELCDVGPVIFDHGLSGDGITHVPVRILPFHPRMVGRGVVRDPVQDHLEPHPVGRLQEMVEVLEGTELGIGVAVVLYGVIGPEGPLPPLFPDGIDGHQPDDVDAELLEHREFPFRRGEGAFFRCLAGIEFIDNRIAITGLSSGDGLLHAILRAG